ncbi:MAG: LptA/OstA family protein [Pseudohongiella sp.]|uniref:LptA/OstA family protein n=1 Tax=Pseudohongiella sp. TaxID=1979412 RepID=UPI0034A0A025
MLTIKGSNTVLRTAALLIVFIGTSAPLCAQPVLESTDQEVANTSVANTVAQEDSNEVLNASADGPGSIESSGNTRITTLRDNVRFQQGLISIFGDTARLEQDIETGDLIKVTVEGQPARFVRAAQADVEEINGDSDSIVYYNESMESGLMSVVEFIGDARFNRGRTALQCSQIKHVVESGATDSPGPCNAVLAPTPQANGAQQAEEVPTTDTNPN